MSDPSETMRPPSNTEVPLRKESASALRKQPEA